MDLKRGDQNRENKSDGVISLLSFWVCVCDRVEIGFSGFNLFFSKGTTTLQFIFAQGKHTRQKSILAQAEYIILKNVDMSPGDSCLN